MTIPMLRDCESEAKYTSRLVESEFVPTTRPRTLGRAQQLRMARHRSRATRLRKIRSQDATSNSSKLSRCEGVQPWQRLSPPRVESSSSPEIGLHADGSTDFGGLTKRATRGDFANATRVKFLHRVTRSSLHCSKKLEIHSTLQFGFKCSAIIQSRV